MKKICVFGGTTEGRMLTELFARKTDFHLCVATEYGEEVLGSAMEYGKIHVGRMSEKDMEKFLLAERFDLAVDATHPYAAEVSRNINSACENTSTVLLRCSRNACGTGGFENVRAAADYLAGKEGNIFVATGSKELSEYTRIPGYKERLFVRVLFCRQALEACEAIGLTGKNVIAMQGPFSVEQNVAAIRAAGAKYFVTKDSGAEGGMPAKEEAARICGAELIRIGRPCEEGDAKDFGTTVREISSRLGIEPYREVYLIGTGVGQNGMSGYAREIISSCGLLIGAPRMLADVQAKVPCVAGYRPEEIKKAISDHAEVSVIGVLLSGDVGFYSAAQQIENALDGMNVKRVAGICSLSVFAARLGIPWQDAKLVSLHGRNGYPAKAISENRKTFFLLGGEWNVQRFLGHLKEYGFGELNAAVAENLGYVDEKIVKDTVSELEKQDFRGLCVAYIENPFAKDRKEFCDGMFTRGEVPMTKQQVRTVSVSELGVTSDGVVWDIGCGTGAMTVTLAARAKEVWAVDCNEEAVRLTKANAKKMHMDNIIVKEGKAPAILKDLPAPDYVFLGGSSGRITEVLEAVFEKNSRAVIVANAVTLETVSELSAFAARPQTESEVTMLQVSKAYKAGSHRLMKAENPIFIFRIEQQASANADLENVEKS